MAQSSIQLVVDASKALTPLNQTEQAVKKLDKAVREQNGSLRNSGRSLSGAAGGARALGASAKLAAPGVNALGTAVKAALGPVGLLFSAAGALTQAFQTLAAQDFAEAKVRTLGVNSKELVTQLKGVSNELQGQASVVELTGAAYDVASAGFTNAADNAKILKAASQGAIGGFSDLNTVGDATTSVLNAYGLQADKAAKLVDSFIQTQNDGKIVIGEYAANIAKVAPVAAALKVPLEEVNAAVAQITAGGQGAEVTFTALKTAFAQIAAGKVGEEFKKFGVEINSSTLASDGLAGTLDKIKKSGADAGTIIKAFGTEAGPSILALLNDTEKYNRLLENQKNSQGAAAKAAFEAADTIQGSIKRLQTAFSNLFADGSELGVLLKSIFKVAAVTVEVFAVIVKNTLAPFRALIAAVTEIGDAINKALGTDGINVAFELEKAYRGFLDTLSQIGDFIVGLGVRFGEFIGGMVQGARNGASGIKQALVGGFTEAFNRISSVVSALYNSLPKPVRFILEKAAQLIGAVGGFTRQIAGQAITAVTGFVTETVAAGRGVTQGVGGVTTPQAAAAASNGISPTGGALGKTKLSDAQKEELRRQKEAQRLAEAATKEEERKQLAYEQQVFRLQQQQALQQAKLDGNEKEVANAYLLTDLIKKYGVEDGNILYQGELQLQNLEDRVKAADKLAQEQKKAAEDLQKVYEGIGMAIKDGVVQAIQGAIDGTKTLREVAVNLLNNIANQLLQIAVNLALFGASSGTGLGGGLLGGLFKGRATGGTVTGGSPYIVGERGPELFMPGRSGSIIPNNAMGGANVTVNVDATGSSVQGNQPDAAQLGRAIGAAVQAELVKQKRPGGLLA